MCVCGGGGAFLVLFLLLFKGGGCVRSCVLFFRFPTSVFYFLFETLDLVRLSV